MKHVLAGIATLVLLAGCAGLGDDVRSGGAGPESPVTSTPGPDTPVASPTPRIVEPGGGLVDVRPQPWEAAEVLDGRTILVSFYGGVQECYGVDRVEVDYRARTIVVTLYAGRVPDAEVCIEIAEYQAVEVGLDEPLDGRAITDGTDPNG